MLWWTDTCNPIGGRFNLDRLVSDGRGLAPATAKSQGWRQRRLPERVMKIGRVRAWWRSLKFRIRGVQREDLAALAAEVAENFRRELDAAQSRSAEKERRLLESVTAELEAVRSKFTTELDGTRGEFRTGVDAARGEFTTGLDAARSEFATGLHAARSELAAKIEALRLQPAPAGPPRRLDWTPQLVARFWDGVGATRLNELSFSKMIHGDIATLFRRFVEHGSRILDFGGGDGALVRTLIDAGHTCALHEPSPRRREQLEADLSGNARFLGAIAHVGANKFDAVTMCEVIEHVLDCDLDNVLQAINHALKPGGILFLTTPYAEDLELNQTYCPVSGVMFHRWQHVRSITPETLLRLLRRHGFLREWLGLVSFSHRESFVEWVNSAEFATGPHKRDGYVDLILPPHENLVLVCRKIVDDVGSSPALSPVGATPIEGPFVQGKGVSYFTHLPEIAGAGDDASNPYRSRVVLFENGYPLGSPHAIHDDIASQGGGAYSHWGDTLLFSATDNSDPNTNGRSYSFILLTPAVNVPRNGGGHGGQGA